MSVTFAIFVNMILAASELLLAVLSLINKGYKNPINRMYSALALMMFAFIVSIVVSGDTSLPSNIVIFANYVAFPAGLATTTTYLVFMSRLANVERITKLTNWLILPFCVIGVISATPLVAAGVYIKDNIYSVTYGPLTWLYVLGLIISMAAIIYGMIIGRRYADKKVKRQLAITGIGMCISLPLVAIFCLIIPMTTGNFSFRIYGPITIFAFLFTLYYSVVKHHLFDIRLAAVRTLAYAMSLSLLISMYYVVAIFISAVFNTNDLVTNSGNVDILLIIILSFVFQPTKKFFDHLTNRIFYRDYYDSDQFLTRFNRILTSTTNLRHLLEQAANEIAQTLKGEQVFFYIYTHHGHHITAGTLHHPQLSSADILDIQTSSKKTNGIVVESLLDINDPIRKLMLDRKIELFMPLIQEGIAGYLFLGNHKTSHYTNRDLKVLNMIDDSLIIAIQNALSVDSIKESNAQLRQIDKIKDEFVSVASHELRTPMTVIRGYVNLLQREQLGPENSQQKAMLEKISQNTKTLIDLVNDMLDLSKLEANKLEMNICNYPIDTLINKSIDQMRLLYNNKQINLEYRPLNNNGNPVIIQTDSVQFGRILLNLLSNAYKFTNQGGRVTVTTSLSKKDERGMVTICVTDTGVGIAHDALDVLFKKFSQVDNYLQRDTGGTGLGLAISKRLVNKLGGEIWVKSTVGIGSQFYFTMPLSEKIVD